MKKIGTKIAVMTLCAVMTIPMVSMLAYADEGGDETPEHEHVFDTNTWLNDEYTHWNPCEVEGCTVRGNEAAHDQDEFIKVVEATFTTNGYSGDKVCSVCGALGEKGEVIPAENIILEAGVNVYPDEITDKMTPSDIQVIAYVPSKYSAAITKCNDITDNGANHSLTAKFESGHDYVLEITFVPVGDYIFDEEGTTAVAEYLVNGMAVAAADGRGDAYPIRKFAIHAEHYNGPDTDDYTGIWNDGENQYYYENGVRSTETDVKHIGSVWYNLVDGMVVSGPTVAHNSNGWWYIDENGKVDFNFEGFAENSNGIWYCKKGKVDFTVSGVIRDPSTGKWGYTENSRLQVGNVTVKGNQYGWWYIGEDGYVDFTFNGFASNENGTWYLENGKVNFKYTGFMTKDEDTVFVKEGKLQSSSTDIVLDPLTNKWGYIVNGVLQSGEATVAHNSNGWWYIGSDGYVDFTFTGFASNDYGTWYCKGGYVDFKTTSVVQEPATNKWGYVVQNKLQTGKATVAQNSNGWWYIAEDGYVDFTFTGFASNENGTWYCKGGRVDFTFTGFASNENGTWYCKGGLVDFKTTGVVQEPSTNKWGYVVQNKLQIGEVSIRNNAYGWWYVGKDGYVDFTFTGLESNESGKWYFEGGKVIFSYTGLAKDSDGWWYVSGGKVDLTYSGKVTWNGDSYVIVNGQVQ